jgi:hypothetical protein
MSPLGQKRSSRHAWFDIPSALKSGHVLSFQRISASRSEGSLKGTPFEVAEAQPRCPFRSRARYSGQRLHMRAHRGPLPCERESCVMPRAGHVMTLDFSLGQWPFLVRAGIFESKERAFDVEQSNFLALDVHESSLARCDLVRARNLQKFSHALSSSMHCPLVCQEVLSSIGAGKAYAKRDG